MREHKLLSTQQAADYMGVSRQTVSNYISRGILKAFDTHKNNRYPMVDKAAIDDIFDSINDVETSRKEMEKMKEELDRDRKDIKKELDDARGEKTLVRYLNSIALDNGILAAIISSMGNNFTSREENILTGLLSGKSVRMLSEDYHISSSRLLQIVQHSIFEIQRLPKYSDLEDRIKDLERQNGYLRESLRTLQKEKVIVDKDTAEWMSGDLTSDECHMIELYNTRLSDLCLSVRTQTALRMKDIDKLGELVQLSRDDIRNIRGIGKKNFSEADDLLWSFKLDFSTDISPLLNKYSKWLADHPEEDPPVTVKFRNLSAPKVSGIHVIVNEGKKDAPSEKVARIDSHELSGRWHQPEQERQRRAFNDGSADPQEEREKDIKTAGVTSGSPDAETVNNGKSVKENDDRQEKKGTSFHIRL